MAQHDFSHGWTVQASDSPSPFPVDLPHDAMITEPRSADAPSGSHGGYFAGGIYTYRKRFTLGQTDINGRISLVFEGVHGHATVSLDGQELANWDSGYRAVEVPLENVSAGPHEVVVTVDNQPQPTARWYTGSGIYRPVWLELYPSTSIDRRAVSANTRLVGSAARLDVSLSVLGDLEDGDTVQLRLHTDSALVAADEAPIYDRKSHLELTVPRPALWSVEHPHRYRAELSLMRGGKTLDSYIFPLGLRTIDVDPTRGLRINGQRTLLRGACVHHDNGLMGAATHRAAEYRRARLLKEAGYNAIRSAHNPLSSAFLEACDEIGLYVVDELTDVWFASKTAHDAADRFDNVWPEDAIAMIVKDRLHPSVIMYSIGNENAETATPRGITATADISRFVRAADPDRPVTIGMNFMLNSLAARSGSAKAEHPPESDEPSRDEPSSSTKKAPSAVTSTFINLIANRLGPLFQFLAKMPAADRATRQALAEVDVSGYNYAWTRYRSDRTRHPSRVILGTESFPGDLPRIWPLVETLPNVIGDFNWTGWDYLGETGIGTFEYDAGRRASLLAKPFPHVVAGPGAIDITGRPGAPVALQQAVWRQRTTPAIMVRPVMHSGKKVQRTAWRVSDAINSWSWRGYEGSTAEVEVYSSADEVELILNGRVIQRRRSGRRSGYVTRFSVPYESGELTAVAYSGGNESGRSALHTAGVTALRLRPETFQLASDGDDLAFVSVELADQDGVVNTAAIDTITVTIDGPASLVAFGSANPAPLEPFTGTQQVTYYGRALLVLRSETTAGPISIRATSVHHETAQATLAATPRQERIAVDR